MFNDWLNDGEEKKDGFLDILNNVLYSSKEDDIDYEKEKKRYRDAIVEQNLYDGETYEDLYDELNGDK